MRLNFWYFLAFLFVAVAARGKKSLFNDGYSTLTSVPRTWSGSSWSSSGYYPSAVNYNLAGNTGAYYSGYGRGSSWNNAGTGYDSALYNGKRWQGADGTYSGYGNGGLDFYLNWRKNGFVTTDYNVAPYTGGSVYTGSKYVANAGNLAGTNWNGYGAGSRLGSGWRGSGYYGGVGSASGLGYGTAGLSGAAGNGYSTVLGGVFGVRDRLGYGGWGSGKWGSGASYGNYGQGTGWNTGSFYAPAGVKPMYSGTSSSYVASALPAISGLYNDGRWSNRGVYNGYSSGLWGRYGGTPGNIYNTGYQAGSGAATGFYNRFGLASGNQYNAANGYQTGFGSGVGSGVGAGTGSYVYSKLNTADAPAVGPTVFNVYGAQLAGATVPAVGADGYSAYVLSRYQNRPYSTSGITPMYSQNKWNVDYSGRKTGYYAGYGQNSGALYSAASYKPNYYSTLTNIRPSYSSLQSGSGVLNQAVFPSTAGTIGSAGFSSNLYNGAKWSNNGVYAGYGDGLQDYWTWRKNGFKNTAGVATGAAYTGYSGLGTGASASGWGNTYLASTLNRPQSGYIAGVSDRYDAIRRPLTNYQTGAYNTFTTPSIATSVFGINANKVVGSVAPAVATVTSLPAINSGAFGTYVTGNRYQSRPYQYTSGITPMYSQSKWSIGDGYYGGYGQGFGSRYISSTYRPSYATTLTGISQTPAAQITAAVFPTASTAGSTNYYSNLYNNGRWSDRGIYAGYGNRFNSYSNGNYNGLYGAGYVNRYQNPYVNGVGVAGYTTGSWNQKPLISGVGTTGYTTGSWNQKPLISGVGTAGYTTGSWNQKPLISGVGTAGYTTGSWNQKPLISGVGTAGYTAGAWNQNPYISGVGAAGYTTGSWNQYNTVARPAYSSLASNIYSVNAAKIPQISPSNNILGIGSSIYSTGYKLGVTPSIATSVNGLAESNYNTAGNSIYGKYVSTNYQNRPYSTSGISPIYSQSKWTGGVTGLGAGYYSGYGQNSGAYYSTGQYKPSYTSKYATAIDGVAQVSPAVFPNKVGVNGLYSGDKWNNNGVYSGYGNGLDFYWNWRRGGFVGDKSTPSAVYSGYKGNAWNSGLTGTSLLGTAAGQGASWNVAPSTLGLGASSIYGYGGRWSGRPYGSYLGANSIYNGNRWSVNNRGQDSGLYYGYGYNAQNPYYGQAGIYSGKTQLNSAIYPSASATFLSSGNMGSLYNNGQWRNDGVYAGYGTNLDSSWRWGANGLLGNRGASYYGGSQYSGPYSSAYYSSNGDYANDGSYSAASGWKGRPANSWEWNSAWGSSPTKSSQWSWASKPTSWVEKTFTSTPWRSPSLSYSHSWK